MEQFGLGISLLSRGAPNSHTFCEVILPLVYLPVIIQMNDFLREIL